MPQVSRWRDIRREALRILAAVAVVLTARTSLADHYVVPTGSMEPTILPSERVLVNKLAYGVHFPFLDYVVTFDGPERGDVVVLVSPEDGKVLLKRVVALPGDRVTVDQGRIELNGRAVPVEADADGLHERLGPSPHPLLLEDGGGPPLGPVTVPDGRYLVLGDNRGNSHDGRAFGFVPRSRILGRVAGVYYGRGGLGWHPL